MPMKPRNRDYSEMETSILKFNKIIILWPNEKLFEWGYTEVIGVRLELSLIKKEYFENLGFQTGCTLILWPLDFKTCNRHIKMKLIHIMANTEL